MTAKSLSTLFVDGRQRTPGNNATEPILRCPSPRRRHLQATLHGQIGLGRLTEILRPQRSLCRKTRPRKGNRGWVAFYGQSRAEYMNRAGARDKKTLIFCAANPENCSICILYTDRHRVAYRAQVVRGCRVCRTECRRLPFVDPSTTELTVGRQQSTL